MSTEQRAFVGVFVKQPLPGRVKTRLEPLLSDTWAAGLYEAFLRDTVALATACAGDRVVLFYEGEPPHAYLPDETGIGLCREVPQRGTDLGERLAAAVSDAALAHALPLLLLGSDSPDLPRGLLDQALAATREADLVLGPAADGGLWAIGVATAVDGLFEGLPWSTPRVGEALRNRAADLGLKVTTLPLWYDVDEPADLIGLDRRLLDESKARWTSEWMSAHPWRHAVER